MGGGGGKPKGIGGGGNPAGGGGIGTIDAVVAGAGESSDTPPATVASAKLSANVDSSMMPRFVVASGVESASEAATTSGATGLAALIVVTLLLMVVT